MSETSGNEGDAKASASAPVVVDHVASKTLTSDETLYPVDQIRNRLFSLSALVGKLSAVFLGDLPLDSQEDGVSDEARTAAFQCSDVADLMTNLLAVLESTASLMSLDVTTCILKKVQLNRKKYPVELCAGRAGK
jgi:hypothetical protein